MAFDFPTSPAENQEFTPPIGTPTYVFKTPRWLVKGVAAAPAVSDTPPATPATGQLWWESDTGNLYIWFDDGTSSQWVQVNIAPPIPLMPSPFKRTVLSAIGVSTTFQYDVTTLFADIEVVGGGGGGATTGGPSSGAGLASVGGGGGGGGYAKKLIEVTAAVRVATKTIGIGAGGGSSGAGGASSYGDGVNALTANGGGGGFTGGAWGGLCNYYAGGGGGSASGGDLNITGGRGGFGMSTGSSANGAGIAAGAAGNGAVSYIGGQGGLGAYAGAVTGANSLPGNAAASYGAGGGGALGLNLASNAAGGVGFQGCVIITEYR